MSYLKWVAHTRSLVGCAVRAGGLKTLFIVSKHSVLSGTMTVYTIMALQ